MNMFRLHIIGIKLPSTVFKPYFYIMYNFVGSPDHCNSELDIDRTKGVNVLENEKYGWFCNFNLKECFINQLFTI